MSEDIISFKVQKKIEKQFSTFFGITVAPLTVRRIQTFKANRRGYWSFWIFITLFTLSIFAELIATDKPLMVEYQGSYYFPIMKIYPETVFGGVFETEAEYREKEVQDLIKEKEGRIYWPLIRYSHDTVNLNLNRPAPSPPTLENLLGTDDQARDVLARVIYGFRLSVLFGLILTILSSIFGIAAGAIQG